MTFVWVVEWWFRELFSKGTLRKTIELRSMPTHAMRPHEWGTGSVRAKANTGVSPLGGGR
jgi:hypothetical protein